MVDRRVVEQVEVMQPAEVPAVLDLEGHPPAGAPPRRARELDQ
jgi:hypothetical protein